MALRNQRAPDECTFCGSKQVVKNRDEDFVCDDCGFVIKHAEEEVDYLQ